jgi:hypothetical protein
MNRGRPKLTMTHRRQQVLQAYADTVADRGRVSWAELARRCNLHSYNDARRIIRDLQRMGQV